MPMDPPERDASRFTGLGQGHTDPMDEHQQGEEVISTDAVLSESVERVRSSRQLIDEIDERLQRGQQLLDGDADRR